MITIVISSYQYGHLASHCIESVLSQTQKPERILFVDDGAGDCTHLPKFYPEVEFLFREYNLGVVDNFDDMLRRANSEYVMFLGADNWLRSDTIEVFNLIIKEKNPDVVTYDIVVTGELKNEIRNRHPNEIQDYEGDIYWTRNGHHGSMLYRTKLGQEIGYKKRDENSTHTEEDWNMWNEMIKKNARIMRIPQAFLYYRRHRENFLKY
jgi:glycosyltransferase involved in cell wall biosynthesis